jgi:uncharacterized repeat protein (TIGR03803 family)
MLPGGDLTENQAAVTLSGSGSFPQIAALADNAGSFSLLAGASFTTFGDLQSPGNLTVGGLLAVQGNLVLSSGSNLTVQFAGAPASSQFSRLSVEGTATLAGTLDLAVAGGYVPVAGQIFAVAGYAAETGTFASIQSQTGNGVPTTFTAAVYPTTVVVTAVSPLALNITDTATPENTPTTSGLMITPNAADAAVVNSFQITGTSGGSLFLNDGVTPVSNGEFITVAQGAAGLKFTPTNSSQANGNFTAKESTTGDSSGLIAASTAVATITLLLPAGPPSVTNATTGENAQTTTGLVITSKAADAGLVNSFQIENISGGLLFLSDGATPVTDGDFLTVAQAAAGLKFTPTSGSLADGSFTVQESATTDASGLSGAMATATITMLLPELTAFQLLRAFTDTATDGGYPQAALTVAGSTLYGTTLVGGSANDGTVFSYNSTSGFHILHSFTDESADGGYPYAGLTLVGSTLYGTTSKGGSGGEGTVFSINTDGSDFQLLDSFGNRLPVAFARQSGGRNDRGRTRPVLPNRRARRLGRAAHGAAWPVRRRARLRQPRRDPHAHRV